MNAGKTNLSVGTRIRVVGCTSAIHEDEEIIGAEGTITHPFPGLMWPNVHNYVAGIYLENAPFKSEFNGGIANLTTADTFEVIE